MLVISAKSGQLGNRLLLFAHFIAFALEHNFKVLNPAFEEYAEFFQSTARDFSCSYPPPAFSVRGNKFIRRHYYSLNRFLVESGRFNTIAISRKQPFSWSKSSQVKQIEPGSVNFFQGWLFCDGWFIAQCDYIIGPPSSYTMWASFYGNTPLYMIRDIDKVLDFDDFIHFCEWKGIFHYRDDWSKSFWEWTH